MLRVTPQHKRNVGHGARRYVRPDIANVRLRLCSVRSLSATLRVTPQATSATLEMNSNAT